MIRSPTQQDWLLCSETYKVKIKVSTRLCSFLETVWKTLFSSSGPSLAKLSTLVVGLRSPFTCQPTSSTEKAMAPHSSTLAWKIPCTEEPGRLQSIGSQRIGHDWVTSLSLFTFMHWRRKWQPLQCSCLENPRDGGAWWAAVYGVAQSRTGLMRLSSSSSLLHHHTSLSTLNTLNQFDFLFCLCF